jgi:pimeloyl-ACP methyl ester carboxylesterase
MSASTQLSRRTFVVTLGASTVGAFVGHSARARAASFQTGGSLPSQAYGNGTIPAGIRARTIANVNGLTVNMLEAGFERPGSPAILLLHGFPELAFSWRKVMLPLAAAGYHVIAPDQRGYGRTTGWDDSYDADPDPFRMLNMVRDAMALVYALGHRSVATVVGHDAGAPVAAWAALVRPDVFRTVTIMSSPFEGPPSIPFDTANGAAMPRPAPTDDELDVELAKLNPPRKYYQNYQRTRGANDNMLHARQGLHAFFRAYYHYKSADWKGNHPHPLKARTADEMAQIPTYYVMDKDKGMAETVEPFMPSPEEIANCKWLTEAEVDVYATEYGRTGFTGALQGYRVRRGSDPKSAAELRTFAGRSIDVPSMYIAGKSDWGVYQTPGAVDRMQKSACSRMVGFHLIDGAGHWVQQEQPDQVSTRLLAFLREHAQSSAKP